MRVVRRKVKGRRAGARWVAGGLGHIYSFEWTGGRSIAHLAALIFSGCTDPSVTFKLVSAVFSRKNIRKIVDHDQITSIPYDV